MSGWLNPEKLTGEEVGELWKKIQSVEGAYDDRLKGQSDLFVLALFQDLFYDLDKKGLIRFSNTIPKAETTAHLIIWDKSEPLKLVREIRQVLIQVFVTQELVRCNTSTASFNEDSLRLAKLLGFTEEGRLRKATMYNGEYYDTVIFGLLSEDLFKEISNGS